jgi:hypothetical protein
MKKSSLPIIIGISAVAAYALSSKPKVSTSSSSLPFLTTCESITIKDPAKTDQWFIDQTREYIQTLPDLESLSYTTLVSRILQKANKACYDKFMSGKMTKNEILLAAIIRDKAQKGFITSYFGNPAILQGDDLINYNQFAEVIHPERLAEFSTFIKWDSNFDSELTDALKSVELYKKWP